MPSPSDRPSSRQASTARRHDFRMAVSATTGSYLFRMSRSAFSLVEPRDLELLRLHLAVARKRVLRIVGELLHPIAQLRHMHVQVLRSLHIGHASLLDQAHSLKLELAGKLPSLHDPPPLHQNT